MTDVTVREAKERRPTLKAMVTAYHQSAALRDIDNSWISLLLRRPTFDEIYDALIHEPAGNTLQEISESYMPTDEIVTCVGQIIGAMVHALERKDFGDPEFLRYFFALAELFNGKRKVTLPAYPSSLSGVGIRITGVSRSGKTALLQRLRTLLGPAHMLNFPDKKDGRLCFVPILIVNYPDCGKVEGFIANIREQLLSQLANVDTKPSALKEMLKGDKVASAICACMTANVGLIAIDGACFDTITGDMLEVLKSINKIKNYTGIPVIFIATPVFMHVASKRGSIFSNLCNGPALHLPPLEEPEPAVDEKTGEVTTGSDFGLWSQMCQWMFGLWRFSQEEMPQEFPSWTYPYALGRMGWLAEGFDALRAASLSNPNFSVADITEDTVTSTFDNQLNVHAGARMAILKSLGEKPKLDDADFLSYLDHYDTALFNTEAFRKHLNGYGMKLPKELRP